MLPTLPVCMLTRTRNEVETGPAIPQPQPGPILKGAKLSSGFSFITGAILLPSVPLSLNQRVAPGFPEVWQEGKRKPVCQWKVETAELVRGSWPCSGSGIHALCKCVGGGGKMFLPLKWRLRWPQSRAELVLLRMTGGAR